MFNSNRFVVSTILDVVENTLYSVHYNNFEKDEFSRLFNNWSDGEYLEAFFNEHINDLENDFWDDINIEDAIFKTYKDAADLEEKLIDLAEQNNIGTRESLTSFFQLLSSSDNALSPPSMNKAYGTDSPSWLRIYALEADTNLFVITGGAIKLTKTMNEREHLKLELTKLNISKQFIHDYPLSNDGEDIPFFELIY